MAKAISVFEMPTTPNFRNWMITGALNLRVGPGRLSEGVCGAVRSEGMHRQDER
jgi:hypothetical protein